MSRCLKVLKEVEIPVENNRFLFVDIFLTEDYLCVVPYTVFAHSHSNFGQFTLSGMLMGGIGGLIVGTAIDSIKDSIFGGKADNLEQARKKAELQREKDFGKSVEDRIKKQRGVKIPKQKVTSVDCKDGWCIVTSSQEQAEIVPLFGLGGDSLEIAETVKKWFSGNLPLLARDGVEGANVGITIEDFISSFEKTNNPMLSGEVIQCMPADHLYIEKITNEIINIKFHTRKVMLEWIVSNAPSLRDAIKNFLKESLRRAKKRRKRDGIIMAILVSCFSVVAIILSPEKACILSTLFLIPIFFWLFYELIDSNIIFISNYSKTLKVLQ